MNVEKALEYLSGKVDEGEIFYVEEKSKNASIKNVELDLFKEKNIMGYGIRVIHKKSMGFSYGNILTKDLLEKAVKIARVAEKDENLNLPSNQKYTKIAGLYDKNIPEIPMDDLSGMIEELTKPALDLKVIPTHGVIAWSDSISRLWNTNGIQGEEKGTSIMGYISTVAREANDTSSGFYYDVSRKKDIDLGEIGMESARLARDSLNAEPIGTGNMNISFAPFAVSELFESVLLSSFNADNVQRGRSYLGDKIGRKVFSESLNFIDDSTLKGGLSSQIFDGEGISSQKTSLVQDGVLKGFLYDCYTAGKEGVNSTGNAARESFYVMPRVDVTNFIIDGKGKSPGEGMVVNGVIGAHTSNPISGDFSVESRNAFLDGVPVKKAIISGNIYELLNNLVGFGDDTKQIGSIITPTLEFSDVRVIG